VLTAGLLVLAGCGSEGDSTDPSTVAVSTGEVATTAAPESSAPAASSAPSVERSEAFPVTVTGANGDVTIESRPERIVVLSPSLTEMTFAVGAGDQVVAVDTYSDHPADVPTSDLSGFSPNVEAIGALDPDLVLVSRDTDDVVATLEGVGIPALVLPSAKDLDEVYAEIETVGAATGHPSEAAALTAEMRADIDEQFARLDGVMVPVDHFYELSADFRTITSDTFVGSLIEQIGMANIADGVDPEAGAYPQLSAEFVLDADPQQLFFAHTDGSIPTAEEIAARPGWSTLQAVVDGNLIFLDPDIASRWGPRVVDLVTAIVDGLVGES
jgi:iron complex transport system substrate-binding protein